MNIGIVTTWFESGAGHVSMQYKKVLERCGNKVFIFARGSYYAKGDPYFDVPLVHWSKPVHTPEGKIFRLKEFENWLIENKIDIAFFNEQTWLAPVTLCNSLAVKTGAYIDYYKKDTINLFDVFDFVICNTKRHLSVFRQHPQCYYIPWGTDVNVFKPAGSQHAEEKNLIFFHSCATTPGRKGTDILIKAFSLTKGDAKLLIHSQINLARKIKLPASLLNNLIKQRKLEIIRKTVGPPGLYNLGDIYVYPSRLEGIGLSIAEAISSGLALITTDNPPMNEFGNEKFARYVKPVSFRKRNDNYYWEECEPSVEDLAAQMQFFIDQKERISGIKDQARAYAIQYLDWFTHSEEIDHVFKSAKIRNDLRKKEATDHLNSIKPKPGIKNSIYKISPGLYERIFYIYEKGKQKRLMRIQKK